MAGTNLQSENHDSQQMRRRAARQALGWNGEDSEDASSDHVRTCLLLEEGGFFPDRRLASFAVLTCETGHACDDLTTVAAEQLAKAELDHFSRRYFFWEPEDRLSHWTQLIEVVAPYPVLAWRHSRLKDGLQIPRDVLRPLGDRVELASALIEWSLRSPRLATSDVRRFVLKLTQDSSLKHATWDEWSEIQLKTRLFRLLVPTYIASLRSRLEQASSNKYAENLRVTVESATPRSDFADGLHHGAIRSLCVLIALVVYLASHWGGSSPRTPTTFQDRPGHRFVSKPKPKPSVLETTGIPISVVGRDQRRGELILNLLRNPEIMRRNDDSDEINGKRVVPVQVQQAVELLKSVTLLHSAADKLDGRKDGTVRDVGLILSRSDQSFQCVGYGRLDPRLRISHAVWVNGREPITAQAATAIAEKLKGEPSLDNDQRSALENELERVTKLEVMILTPAEFLATFEQSLPVNNDVQATPQFSTELPSGTVPK